MARPRSKIDITCQNPECKYFFVESGKDIIKRGKNRAGHQQYYCNEAPHSRAVGYPMSQATEVH